MNQDTLDYALAILDDQLKQTKATNSYEQRAQYEGMKLMLNIILPTGAHVEIDHRDQHHITTK